MTNCIITGCALFLEYSHSFAWGDMHLLGDRFIFNGNTDRDGRMAWTNHAPKEPAKALTIPVGEEYFERMLERDEFFSTVPRDIETGDHTPADPAGLGPSADTESSA